MTAEAERVRDTGADAGGHGCVRDVVEVTVGVRYAVVDGRRRDLVGIASTVVASSIAPAAEIVWPIIDLVELTSNREASGPNTVLIAAVSTRSFIGVEVPWALT